jgi:SAM-dependent methyltransferase
MPFAPESAKLSRTHNRWFHKADSVRLRLARSMKESGYRRIVETSCSLIQDFIFDWRLGTETRRWAKMDDLAITSNNKGLGIDYHPTRVRAFRKLMRWLDLPEGRVLVDVGCGKGRILIASASFPFGRIIGIEFAPELGKICRRNIDAFRKRVRSDVEFTVNEIDAVDYTVQDDEDVFFFFNPFRLPVMNRFLGNIRRSLETRPRTVWLIINRPRDIYYALENEHRFVWIGQYIYGSSRFWIYSNNPAEIARLHLPARAGG